MRRDRRAARVGWERAVRAIRRYSVAEYAALAATIGAMDRVTGVAALHPRRRDRQLQQGRGRTRRSPSRPRPRRWPRSKQRLGARLLHRSTRGVTPTEVGALYYDKCKADRRARSTRPTTWPRCCRAGRRHAAHQHLGGLRPARAGAAGAALHARAPRACTVDLGFDDRYVNLVEQGIDLAMRMGRLADSTLGARYLGTQPLGDGRGARATWRARGTPRAPADLAAPRLPDLQQRAGRRPLDASRGADGRGRERRCRCRGRCARTTCRPCWPRRAPAWASRSCRGTSRANRWPTAACVPLLADHGAAGAGDPRGVPVAEAGAVEGDGFIGWVQQALQGDWWLRAL